MLFKGTHSLTKFIFRQRRFKIIIWLLGLILVTLAAASAYPEMYKGDETRQAYALTMENPAMIAMLGVGYDLEDYLSSVGTLFAHEMLLFTIIAVAIMNILLVGRSTRADEEDGRIEMIRALSVGRLAYTSASMIVVVITNLLLALLTGLGLGLLGIEGFDFESSLLYGSILGVSGLLFGSITAVFAQLTETSRGTTMSSFAILIGAYLIRAIGDVSNEMLSYVSPLGWLSRTGVFADNNWGLFLLTLIVAIVILLLSFYLNAIRDLGVGFIAARKGKRHANPFLQTTFGLTLRLGRTNIVTWAIGMFAMSLSFGAVLGDLEAYFIEIEFMQAFIEEESGYTMTEQFITLLMAIMSLISVIPAVMTVLKLKGEENKFRTENYYSRAVSRTNVLGNHYFLAILVCVLMQSLVALGLWSVGQSMMDDALSFGTTFASAFVYLPAMWVVISLATLLVGSLPKLTSFVWLYVVYCFIVVYLSGILDFPEWLNNLSVFEHVPQIPAEDMNFMVMIVLGIVAIVVTVIGFMAYNRRDIAG
ncbi:ABC transporter permease [Oceanobacillus bengalensis]|uniref:ABC transporter permease n=1 Tax=Oceanobacillus bengalensis TaxID=1435466 RepID=A0A494YU25_9BACI|nr:ABC transporter permease [Oceanobacillus bengalensis]RKQ13640.1 ABC transporter permease [Oceanobacillus bengalensis]